MHAVLVIGFIAILSAIFLLAFKVRQERNTCDVDIDEKRD